MIVTIINNGKGLKKENNLGNGLKNMAKKMLKIGGRFELKNTSDAGIK
jgi:signal transduction histidine kinase